jgi:hypothetical protein
MRRRSCAATLVLGMTAGSVLLAPTTALAAPSTVHETSFENGGAVKAKCAPSSGSRFLIGTTKVTCTATDAAGNRSNPMAFDVVVTRGAPGRRS